MNCPENAFWGQFIRFFFNIGVFSVDFCKKMMYNTMKGFSVLNASLGLKGQEYNTEREKRE